MGFGEASPNAFYHENADDVRARLTGAGEWLLGQRIRSVSDIARVWQEAWPLLQPSRAAQCALDVALWDWLARREGCSVAELAHGSKARGIATFCTIGISSREELEAKVSGMRGYPMVKIKMDRSANLEPVRFVREQTGAKLAVDANAAWDGLEIGGLSAALAEQGGLFIEQPLPPQQDVNMPEVLSSSKLPVIADESCVSLEDVERMPGRFSGFNIKLVKCGGLTPALSMAQHGRSLGLRTMVGCMLESSLLIAAGAVVAQQTDFADLDGAWLLRDDPFGGWQFDQGMLYPPTGAGLGVKPLIDLSFDPA